MTNKTNPHGIVVPPLPAPLDITRLHTRAEVRAHEAAVQAHHAANRAVEQAERQAAIAAQTPHFMTDSEYEQMAVDRLNRQREQDVAREAERQAEAERKKEALAASPDVAEVLASDPVNFLLEVQHWVQRGYTVDFDGPLSTSLGLYHVRLKAQAKKLTVKESA